MDRKFILFVYLTINRKGKIKYILFCHMYFIHNINTFIAICNIEQCDYKTKRNANLSVPSLTLDKTSILCCGCYLSIRINYVGLVQLHYYISICQLALNMMIIVLQRIGSKLLFCLFVFIFSSFLIC